MLFNELLFKAAYALFSINNDIQQDMLFMENGRLSELHGLIEAMKPK